MTREVCARRVSEVSRCTSAGGRTIDGPGYGNYAQAMLQNVDAGDLVAMTLTNQSSGNTYWAFSQANETVGGQPVGYVQ